MLKITPIPALKDNYIWALTNTATKQTAIVDPGDAKPVVKFLKDNDLQLSSILVTHHHHDHTGGIAELLKLNNVTIIKPENLQQDSQVVLAEQNLTFNVIAIPGHTLDHLAFYNDQLLFCGDTLFAAGCGRVFEGTAVQMFAALQRLKQLKPTTKMYCAHEYTVNNLRFAMLVEPNNEDIRQRLADAIQMRAENLPTLPSTIALELATNPFLRTAQEDVRFAVNKHFEVDLIDEVEIFSALRRWKDVF